MKRMIFLLLLAGCGQDPGERGPPPPESCTLVGDSGMCVGIDDGALITDLQVFNEHYTYVMQCMGLNNVPGPVVRVTAGLVNGYSGLVDMNNGQVSIYHPWVIRHEFVHYILWKTGYPHDRNRNHDHPAFDPGTPDTPEDERTWCAS